ncbi:hypothetical protein C6P44_000246 [Monosporozyma unispora]|nr:hypothetical protein C6P44_000246 [Kazachstania unispora]
MTTSCFNENKPQLLRLWLIHLHLILLLTDANDVAWTYSVFPNTTTGADGKVTSGINFTVMLNPLHTTTITDGAETKTAVISPYTTVCNGDTYHGYSTVYISPPLTAYITTEMDSGSTKSYSVVPYTTTGTDGNVSSGYTSQEILHATYTTTSTSEGIAWTYTVYPYTTVGNDGLTTSGMTTIPVLTPIRTTTITDGTDTRSAVISPYTTLTADGTSYHGYHTVYLTPPATTYTTTITTQGTTKTAVVSPTISTGTDGKPTTTVATIILTEPSSTGVLVNNYSSPRVFYGNTTTPTGKRASRTTLNIQPNGNGATSVNNDDVNHTQQTTTPQGNTNNQPTTTTPPAGENNRATATPGAAGSNPTTTICPTSNNGNCSNNDNGNYANGETGNCSNNNVNSNCANGNCSNNGAATTIPSAASVAATFKTRTPDTPPGVQVQSNKPTTAGNKPQTAVTIFEYKGEAASMKWGLTTILATFIFMMF